MSDFITLSCPSCGAKLEITPDIDRFSCSNCGREHIVKRGGGIVSLSPVVDAINQVRSGVDKTAAELALERIPKEMAALVFERRQLVESHPYPYPYDVPTLMVLTVSGALFVIVSIVAFSTSNGTMGILCLVPGLVLVLIGLWPRLTHNLTRAEEQSKWKATTGLTIKDLDERIRIAQSELERNRELVSR